MQGFAFKVLGAAAIIFTITVVGTLYGVGQVIEKVLLPSDK